MVSSVVGFYSSPLFTRLLPVRQDTPLTKVGTLCFVCVSPSRYHRQSPCGAPALGSTFLSTAPPPNTPFPPPDHRELRLAAGAQLGPARLLQDIG